MGEISEMVQEGILCEGCGELLSDESDETLGVPRHCLECARDIGEYCWDSLAVCKESGMHRMHCDDDGYCSFCGKHETDELEEESDDDYSHDFEVEP